MKNTVNERIRLLIKELDYKSARAFAIKIGISQTSFNDILKGAEPKFSTLNKIITAEPLISAEWLLTGTGEMLKQTPSISSSNQGDGNKIEYNHIGIGNSVNANISDSSSQKTIYPTGKVDVAGLDHVESAVSNEDSEKQFLKAEIAHLRESMEIKDELIISLRETIELLRNKEK